MRLFARQVWFLARMDLRYMFRIRETWLWAFLMPVVFFYLLGTIMSGWSERDTRDPIAVRTGPNAGYLADELVRRIQARGYRVVTAPAGTEFAQFRRRLAIPEDFTASVLAGKPRTVSFTRTGGGAEAEYDKMRVMRAVYSVLADLVMLSEGGEATESGFREMAARPSLLRLDVRPAGQRRDPPTGFEQAVPGSMVLFTMIVLFTTGSALVLAERQRGILRRLASSPIPRGAVMLAKWGARLALGCIQLGVCMLAGSLLFHVRWGGHKGTVILVLFLWAGLAAALGMLLGNVGNTTSQVVGIGVILSNVLGALGGCMWPVEIVPAWAQQVAIALPTGWTMDALHRLMSFGDPPSAVALHLAALAAATAVVLYATVRRFRWD